MKKNKLVLDRFFSHVKWLTRKITQFIVVIFILFAIIIGSSNPILYGETIDSTQSQDFYFTAFGSEQTQIGFIAFNPNDGDSQTIHLELSLFIQVNNSWQLYKTYEVWNPVHLQFFGLERGDYKLHLTNLSSSVVEVHLVVAQANPNLLIALAAAIISFAFFWIIIQFAVPIYLVLLIVSLAKEEVIVHQGIESPSSETGPQESIKPSFRPVQSKNNFLGVSNDDITSNNKIGLVIGSLLLLISFLTEVFPLAFIGAIILVTTISEVYSANKLRIRILNLMNTPPFPHSKSIATIAKLAESTPDKVEKLVKRLILDLGYPLELDREHKTITALEPLSMFLSASNERISARHYRPMPVHQSATEAGTVSQASSSSSSTASKYCIKCGVTLPTHVVYCYECGTRND